MDTKVPENLDLEFQERADPRVLSSLDKLGQAIVVIFNHLKNFKIDWPKVFQVKGSVDIDSVADLPPVHIQNFKDLRPYFESLEKSLKYLSTAITLVSSKTPEPIKAPIVNFNTQPLLDALKELKDVSGKTIEFPDNQAEVQMLRNISEGIGQLVERPTFVPPTVTNVNINALQGVTHSSQQTLNTSLSEIPSYGGLFNRRSLIVYNNSGITIYIGGSDVTSNTGLPIPTASYSPVLDVGYNMKVYGLTASSTADIRVLELANEATGR